MRVVSTSSSQKKDIEITTHINDLTSPDTLAHLLRYDSVHGPLLPGGSSRGIQSHRQRQKITVSASKDPAEINWQAAAPVLVMECTGYFRSKDEASRTFKRWRAKGAYFGSSNWRRYNRGDWSQ